MTSSSNSAVRSYGMIAGSSSFDDDFVVLYKTQYQRIYRYLDRMSGDPDAAEDLAQETFVRLYRRGSMPDEPGAWLVSVGMNLLRNMASSTRRRRELLERNSREEDDSSHGPTADAGTLQCEIHVRVRRTIDGMSYRDKSLLLLRAEGYSYKEIAGALEMNVASVGTLLARAQRSFKVKYEESGNAR